MRNQSITKRDIEFLDIWSRGHENCHVAQALGISIQTVKSGARRILGKLKAANRTEACVIALSRGLIPPHRSEP